MRDICEPSGAENLHPLLGGEQVSGRKQQPPLVAVNVIPVIVDQDPRPSTRGEHATDLAQALGRVGPVVSRLHRDGVSEEAVVPGNPV